MTHWEPPSWLRPYLFHTPCCMLKIAVFFLRDFNHEQLTIVTEVVTPHSCHLLTHPVFGSTPGLDPCERAPRPRLYGQRVTLSCCIRRFLEPAAAVVGRAVNFHQSSIISAVHATAGRWPPQLGCGVEPRNPPRWFRAAWWARQLSLRVDSLAMRQVVWGYILPIAGPKQNFSWDLYGRLNRRLTR